MRIVTGDIGGTHARFAIAELRPDGPPLLSEMRRYRTREHDGLASAWEAFRQDEGGALPDGASFGVAAPIDGDILEFANSSWVIDRRRLNGDLGLTRCIMLNDFGAVAQAVSVTPPGEMVLVCGPEHAVHATGVTSIIGPGTGLGVSILLDRDGHKHVIETEGGHAGFVAVTAEEQALLAFLQARFGHVSVERVVSGPGLVAAYAFMGGGEWDVLDAGTLWSAALDGSDALAVRALDLVVGCYGAAVSNIALTHGASEVVLTGGLSNRMTHRLTRGDFAARFVDKGRYCERMGEIPVRLLTYPEPGLLGAAVAFQRAHGA